VESFRTYGFGFVESFCEERESVSVVSCAKNGTDGRGAPLAAFAEETMNTNTNGTETTMSPMYNALRTDDNVNE
jgi:hypothetical protein